jgi:hypothetical protein
MTPERPGLAGTYMILNTADSSLASVMPSSRAVTLSIVSTANVSMAGVTTISGVSKGDSLDLGRGGKIAGYATHHYRLHRAATITTTFPDRLCTRRVTTVREVWIATDTEPGSILTSAARSLTAGMWLDFPTGKSWMDRLDAAAEGRTRGFALRTVNRDMLTRADGTRDERTTTSEYSAFSRGPFDPSAFTIPPGFRILDRRHPSAPSVEAQRAAAMMAEQRLHGCVSRTKP